VQALADARQRASDKIKARLEEKIARGETIYSSDEEGGEGGIEAAQEELFDEEENEKIFLVPAILPITNPRVREGGREGGREGHLNVTADSHLLPFFPPSFRPSLPPFLPFR